MKTRKRKVPPCEITDEMLNYVFFGEMDEIESKKNKCSEIKSKHYIEKIIFLEDKIEHLNKTINQQSKIINFLNETIFRFITRNTINSKNTTKNFILNSTINQTK